MTLIDRTAYPRFKPHLSAKELSEIYTPTQPEIELAYANARGTLPIVSFVVLLKCFQRLGYFPRLKDVPSTIKQHIRVCLALPQNHQDTPASPGTGTGTEPALLARSLYRYHQTIRTYLKVKIYDENAEKLITTTIRTLAYTRNLPADLINAAVEMLVKERYELPAFSTLDLLVQNLRNQVNSELYQKVLTLFSGKNVRNWMGYLLPNPTRLNQPGGGYAPYQKVPA